MKHGTVMHLNASPRVRASLERFLREAKSAGGSRIQRIVLYGSTARGSATPESDVDLLVVWDGSVLEALDLLIPLTTRILLEEGVDISLHPRTPEEMHRLEAMGSAFLENVEREGVIVEG